MKDVSKLSEQESRPLIEQAKRDRRAALEAVKVSEESIRAAMTQGVSPTTLAKALSIHRTWLYQLKNRK